MYNTHRVVASAKVITLVVNWGFFEANNVSSHLQKKIPKRPSPHFNTKDGGQLDDSCFLFVEPLRGDSATFIISRS